MSDASEQGEGDYAEELAGHTIRIGVGKVWCVCGWEAPCDLPKSPTPHELFEGHLVEVGVGR